jgi:hypothetical protein
MKDYKLKGGTSGVLEYMQKTLHKSKLRQLYKDREDSKTRLAPFVCRAVFQQLSPIAQQFVLRVANTGGKFRRKGVESWVQEPSAVSEIVRELCRWAVLEEDSISKEIIVMTPEFYAGFRDCLRHLALCPWHVVSLHGVADKESPESLERYSYEVWDKVLHFLVGSDSVEAPPDDLVNRLVDTGLMQPDPDDPRPPHEAALVITEKGYDFMLQDQHKQVWLFVEHFLQKIGEEVDTNILTDCLLLLVCLSLARVGEAYSLKSVSKLMRRCLKGLFSSIGLVKIQEIPVKVGDNLKSFTVFYPTRVATQLLGSTSADKAKLTPSSALWSLSSQALEAALVHPEPNDSAHLAIIVQSTFQVCAYTTSELHLRMLSLFCDVPSIRRLPNVIFLRITRDSVKGAFNLGIQARQILRFLEKNAHPRLRTRNANASAGQGMSPIPSNVEDQIWLWDRERSRVSMTEVYQQNCKSDAAFNHILQQTQEIGAHVWSDAKKRVIYVDYSQVNLVLDIVNEYNANPYHQQPHL